MFYNKKYKIIISYLLLDPYLGLPVNTKRNLDFSKSYEIYIKIRQWQVIQNYRYSYVGTKRKKRGNFT